MPDNFVLLVDGAPQAFTVFSELPTVYQEVIAFEPDLSQKPEPGEDGYPLEIVLELEARRDLWVARLQELVANETGVMP